MKEKLLLWKKNYQSAIMIISSFIIIIGTIGFTSFALFSSSATTGTNTMVSGTVNLLLTQPNTNFNQLFYTELSDESGILNDYYEFTVAATATDQIDAGYYIYFTEVTGNTIPKNKIKVYLTSMVNDTETVVFNPKLASDCTPFNLNTLVRDNSATNYFLTNETFDFTTAGSKSLTYRLRIWVDPSYTFSVNYSGTSSSDRAHTATLVGGKFAIKLNVYGIQGTTSPIV